MPNSFRSSQPATPNLDATLLRATTAGTARFRARFADRFVDDFFRSTPFGLSVSSIGIGTYLGDSSDEDDAAYETAIQTAVQSGINLIDTAINYRNQRSERVVGAAIQQLIAAGDMTRQELVVCTKGGYIPLETPPPATREEYQAYVKRAFIDERILHPDEIVAGGHSLAPRFLRYCLAKSRQNLGLRTIDVYYLHNPAQQLVSVDAQELMRRIHGAFTILEESADRGEIGVYGVATWDDLRSAPDHKSHLSLERLVEAAQAVAGDSHHFRVIQLPINLAMNEAARIPTQVVGGRLLTVADAAEQLGLAMIGSATLMQARLARGLPEEVRQAFPRFRTDAQRAIAFARAVPNATAVLVGTKNDGHVAENLESAFAVTA